VPSTIHRPRSPTSAVSGYSGYSSSDMEISHLRYLVAPAVGPHTSRIPVRTLALQT
jgi:hypothetical protein